jgi:hypothetical protein
MSSSSWVSRRSERAESLAAIAQSRSATAAAAAPMEAAPIEIEIEPGLYSVLRGSDETWEAILDDMYMPSQCPWCQITVFAIQDCGYVLCPECKAVFPAEDERGCAMINRVASGVGLGFTFECLLKWQPDVSECRRQRQLAQDPDQQEQDRIADGGGRY